MEKRPNDDDELDDAVMHADDTGMLREQRVVVEEELFHGEGGLDTPDEEGDRQE